MRQGFGMILEQSQKIMMSPELRQAIAVLQMSSMELSEYILEQLQENPLLETEEEAEKEIESEVVSNESSGDVDWQEYFSEKNDPREDGEAMGERAIKGNLEAFTTKGITLAEHLYFQLSISNCEKKIVPVVHYLIGNLDGRGYLQISLVEVAREMKIMLSEAEEALRVLQSFEPAGVGALTLEECLLIQLKVMENKEELAEKIIRSYLSELAQGRWQKIANNLAVSVQEVQQAADTIRLLDPKPGRNFISGESTRYIVPDVIVEKIGDEYVVTVNDVAVPHLQINNFYRSALQKQGNDNKIDGETAKYVESKLNAALWIIRSIEQRKMTIYKVANALVEMQRDFLEKGIKYLKPMNLRQVAEKVGMHESTISRSTSNKYIQTCQGVFEMKSFFSTGLDYSGGEQVSTESIKKIIEEIIGFEEAKNPLSDQKIADLLEEKGLKIARRTVAKYREELGISSARQRKRY